MNKLEMAIEWAEEMDYTLLLLGGPEEQQDFAKAFVGVIWDDSPIAVYSEEKVIDVFVERDGMSYEEALEWYDFNVKTAYMGEQTPIFLMSFES